MRPKARFLVQDASGQPIEDATITLATHRMRFGERVLTQYRTDAAGKVSLRAKHTWKWQILLPDGVTWYEWIYCIDKPGYRPAFEVNPDFSKPVVAVLERSEQRLVCKWPAADQSYWQLSVAEE
jgi:hypothetical protein